MDSRRRTRVGVDLGWGVASRLALLALVLTAAAPASAVDDLAPDLIPTEGGSLEELHGPGRPDDGRLRLRLAWCDILRRTPFPFEVMSAEVERILGGERVEVTWRVIDGDAVVLGDSEVKVILLDRPRTGPARELRVMGSTPREGRPHRLGLLRHRGVGPGADTGSLPLSPPAAGAREGARTRGRARDRPRDRARGPPLSAGADAGQDGSEGAPDAGPDPGERRAPRVRGGARLSLREAGPRRSIRGRGDARWASALNYSKSSTSMMSLVEPSVRGTTTLFPSGARAMLHHSPPRFFGRSATRRVRRVVKSKKRRAGAFPRST